MFQLLKVACFCLAKVFTASRTYFKMLPSKFQFGLLSFGLYLGNGPSVHSGRLIISI